MNIREKTNYYFRNNFLFEGVFVCNVAEHWTGKDLQRVHIVGVGEKEYIFCARGQLTIDQLAHRGFRNYRSFSYWANLTNLFQIQNDNCNGMNE